MPSPKPIPESLRLSIRSSLISFAKHAPAMSAEQRKRARKALLTFVQGALEGHEAVQKAAAEQRASQSSTTAPSSTPSKSSTEAPPSPSPTT